MFIRSILNKCLPKSDLNILTLGYNGYFEQNLAKVANVYVPSTDMPRVPAVDNPNLIVLHGEASKVRPFVEFDLAVCSTPAHYQHLSSLAAFFHIPVLTVQHNLGQSGEIVVLKEMNEQAEHISYSVDLNKYRPNETVKKDGVIIVGNFTQTDYPFIKMLLREVRGLKLFGHNLGLPSTELSETELITEYQAAKSVICLSQTDGLTYSCIHALACGCYPIVNNTHLHQKLPYLAVAKTLGDFKKLVDYNRVGRPSVNTAGVELARQQFNDEMVLPKWAAKLQEVHKRLHIR